MIGILSLIKHKQCDFGFGRKHPCVGRLHRRLTPFFLLGVPMIWTLIESCMSAQIATAVPAGAVISLLTDKSKHQIKLAEA